MSVDLRFLGFSRLECFLWGGVQYTGGIDQAGVGVQLETKSWEVERLDVKVSLGGDWLVGESRQR
jgi:hypothetical protein